MKRLAYLLSALLLVSTALGQESINLRRTTTVEVVEKTKDAVVYISSAKLVAQRINPFGNDPMWQRFDFGVTAMVPANSLGSGFIVHPDGYIVTNNHVIDRARQITVTLLDGRKFEAEVISADTDADLAILKIKADRPLPVLTLGENSDLMIGEPVIAVGNPLGFSHSVSSGIVSAIHRDLKGDDDKVLLGDMIQTDAAINPGNSGGPLLNAYGQVIGINSAIRGDAQNIGFAIPVDRLRDMVPELLNPAQVAKFDIPLKLKEIRTIAPPATITTKIVRAEDGQVVKSIAGHEPRDIFDAYSILLNQHQGQSFDVVLGNGTTIKLQPKAVALPAALVKARNRLGISVETVTPMIAQRLGFSIDSGVYITAVDQNSIAARKGLQPNDVIFRIGQFQIRNIDDFSAIMAALPDSGQVMLGIRRGPSIGYGALQL